MGDALAVALLEARGFTADDFARSHPGGRLGRRLLLHVQDIMRTGDDIPSIPPEVPLEKALLEISKKGMGMAAIIDERGLVIGVYTDGDLRRSLDNKVDIHHTQIGEIMTHPCRTASPDMLAVEALKLMDDFKISALPVTDNEGFLIGALNMHDLLRAGVA
jgi:arabinose-5-phosphate isomerase